MSYFLALDCSNKPCSVAILNRRNLQITQIIGNEQQHGNEQILSLIQQLCVQLNIELNQIDGLICTSGPAALMGTRLSCAILQGLAMGLNKPATTVCALATLAYAAIDKTPDYQGNLQIVTDARCQQIYTAEYEFKQQQLICQKPANLVDTQNQQVKQNALIVGDIDKFKIDNQPTLTLKLTASFIVNYAHYLWQREQLNWQTPSELQPLYLRAAV